MPKTSNTDISSSKSSSSSSSKSSNISSHRQNNPRSTEQQQPAKRVKVTLACTICRKKKVKCDGVQPTCSRCHSIGINCQYSDPPKKRGPPKGYVEVITNRAHRIESLLSANGQHHQQNAQATNIQQLAEQERYDALGATINNSNQLDDFEFAAPDMDRQQCYQQPMKMLLQSIANKAHAALSSSYQQQQNPKQNNEAVIGQDYLHDSNGFLYDFSTFCSTGSNSDIIEKSQHRTAAAAFLQQHEIAWTENFFNYFNLLFPLLSRPQYMHQLARHEVSPILKLAVCILGCRFDSNSNNHGLNDNDKDNNNDCKERQHQHQHQRQHQHQQQLHESLLYTQFFDDYGPVLLSSPASHDISTVQAVIIMCWYTYLAGDMHKCYLLRQLLTAIVNDLQLGYEATVQPSSSSHQRHHYQHGGVDHDIFHTEMKRRAFWVAYVIDLWLAASNLPPSSGENGIDTGETTGRYMLVEQADEKWDCKYPHLEDNQLFALYQFSHQQNQLKLQHTGLNSNGPNTNQTSNTLPVSSSFSVESAFQVNSFVEMIRLFKIVSQFLLPITPLAHTSRVYVHNVQRSDDAVLETKLTEWFLNLPSYLDYGKMTNCTTQDHHASPSPIARIYRILYYTVQIMLNNNANTKLGHERERSMMNKNGGLSNSICTTAANTIVHISEQMLGEEQEKYLYNIFFLSLTSSTSVHLRSTIIPSSSLSANRIHLHKTISLLKRINCSILPSFQLDQLVDTFLLEVCSIVLDDNSGSNVIRHAAYHQHQQQQPSPTHSSSSITSTVTTLRNGKKRVYQPDNDALKVEDWLFNSTYPVYSSKPARPAALVMTATNTITTSNSSNSSCSPPSTPPSFHPTDYQYEAVSAMATPFLNDTALLSVPQTSTDLLIQQQQPFFDPNMYCSDALNTHQQLQLNPHSTIGDTYNVNNPILWSTTTPNTNDWTEFIGVGNTATVIGPTDNTNIGSSNPYCFTSSSYSPSSSVTVQTPPSTQMKETKGLVTNALVEFNLFQAQHQFFTSN